MVQRPAGARDVDAAGRVSTHAGKPAGQFSVKALARRLAVSAAWVYQQVDEGSIPHHRRGALIWFEHDEVVEWLQQHRRPLRSRT